MIEIETMIEIGTMIGRETTTGIVVEGVTEIGTETGVGRGIGTIIAEKKRNMVGRGTVTEKAGSEIGEIGIVAGAEATQGAGVEVETAGITMRIVVDGMHVAVPALEGMEKELMILSIGMSRRRRRKRRRRKRRRTTELIILTQRLPKQIESVHPLV